MRSVGDDVATLVPKQKLVWLPAHKSAFALGEAKLSNGNRLSNCGWRANRLVDMLVKAAAAHFSPSKDVICLLESAEAASAHAAWVLLRMRRTITKLSP